MSRARKNSNNKLVPISGFPELDIGQEIVMQQVIEDIRKVYQKFGFVPLETRLVEPSSILIQKGIDGKEVYCLGRLHQGDVDLGGKTQQKLALRFDLTVPMARYVGQNSKKISFPFKRYQIQKVYRGESANQSSGRFREFYQSDIDVIGQNEISLSYDSEFPAIIYLIFKQVLGINNFVMRINNRKLLEGLFVEFGLSDPILIKKAVKIIDEIEKVSVGETARGLAEIGVELGDANKLLSLFGLLKSLDPEVAINSLDKAGFQNKLILEGISELKQVFDGIIAGGVPKQYFVLDPSIARGLDYYTGTVYETILTGHRHLGSVCSGGRYADLVGTITGNPNDKFPGVGISIGLSRLIPQLISEGVLKGDKTTIAPVLVTVQEPKQLAIYQRIASVVRNGDFNVDVYYNTKAKLAKQFSYADRKGYQYVIVANRQELKVNTVNIRNMLTKGQVNIPITHIVSYLQENLQREELSLKLEEIESICYLSPEDPEIATNTTKINYILIGQEKEVAQKTDETSKTSSTSAE